GSSSQWIATDYLHDDWRAGIFAGRIRWENDAYYLQPAGFGFWSHDVSVLAGVRGGIRTSYADLMLEFTAMHRYNYLFQNHGVGYGPDATYDREKFTIDVRITPRFSRSATPLNSQDAQ